MLPNDLKEEFHEQVERTSSKTKLTYLMGSAEMLENTMKYEEKLRIFFNYNPILGIIANHGKLWEQLAFLCTLLINFIIVFSYSQYFLDENGEVEKEDPNYRSKLSYSRLYDPRIFYRKSQTNTEALIITVGIVNMCFRY